MYRGQYHEALGAVAATRVPYAVTAHTKEKTALFSRLGGYYHVPQVPASIDGRETKKRLGKIEG